MIALMLVAVPIALAPTANAAPDCYDIYNEWTVGPITIVQRSSCNYEVCYEGECGLLS